MKADARAPLIDPADVAQIELYILRRMREGSPGSRASTSAGSGFDLLGLRDWEPGDAVSSIDWAQSSLTNFSPLITRQCEQETNATIIPVVDASPSTRCGARGTTIMAAIARAMAAIGFAAAFFQDRFGFIAFDETRRPLTSARPRVGKSHVFNCLDLYQRAENAPRAALGSDVVTALSAYLHRTSMVPVISDFLFEDAHALLTALARLNAVHDVLMLMVDARFAFELPDTSAGWIEVCDVETGETQTLSRRELAQLATRAEEWQSGIERSARNAGLDLVRVSGDRWQLEDSLLRLVAERRLRKMRR
jgi:uncharacterized protein (DUF58 family)